MANEVPDVGKSLDIPSIQANLFVCPTVNLYTAVL